MAGSAERTRWASPRRVNFEAEISDLVVLKNSAYDKFLCATFVRGGIEH